ncbi:MAG: translocation/assembly module TamB domain-containing protein [Bacteroidales bacterium]|nr:translocation/assembly module TamB domain-containing protein [Bacteroidales bacterium]
MSKVNKYAVRRIITSLFVGLYVLIALLNSTVVQSYIGAAVGSYFSKEWGGKVRIGALHASPISHVILDGIELISPTNDTIFVGDRITCRFKRFPFHSSGLSFRSVELWNGRYHFHSFHTEDGHSAINLNYIINYFAQRATPSDDEPAGPFVVEVGELRLHNIDYIQDLPEPADRKQYPHGVVIAHMRYWDISGVIRNVRVDGDHVNARIVSLTTTEESGLHIEDLSMDAEVSSHGIYATNMDLQTADSRVFMDARLEYNGWEEMSDYCNTVVHDVVLKEGTEVSMRDAAWWAPVLWGAEVSARPQGHVYGTIANMTAEGMVVQFGEGSTLLFDGHIAGLPDIEKTTLHAILHRLHTNYDDLAEVRLPDSVPLPLPEALRQMGAIDLSAEASGGMADIEAWLNMNSSVGDLEAHAHMMHDTLKNGYTYWGDVDSRMLGIRSLLPNEWVGRTGLHLSFQGTGFDPETMNLAVDGRLYNTLLRGKTLERTSFSADMSAGVVNVDAQLHDTLINLDLSALADLKAHDYTADLLLSNAQLTALHLIKSDSAVRLSTRLRANLTGDDVELMAGTLTMDNTHLQIGTRHMDLNHLALQAESRADGYIALSDAAVKPNKQLSTWKRLSVGCDWAEATVEGRFAYSHLPLMAENFCQRFLPTYYNPYPKTDGSTDDTYQYLADDNLNIELLWTDYEGTFADWMPSIMIAEGSHLRGNYNYGEALKLVFQSDSLRMGGISLHDVGLDAGTVGESYRLRLQAADAKAGSMALLTNPAITAGMAGSLSTLALTWGNRAEQPPQNSGDLELLLTSSETGNRIMVTKPYFYVMGQQWIVVCPNGVQLNREHIKVDNLKVYGMDESVRIDADIAGSAHSAASPAEDYVQASFEDFSVNKLCALLLAGSPMQVQGSLDGNCRVQGLSSNPLINANLKIDDFALNDLPLGDLSIVTHQQPDDPRVYVDLVADAKGYQPLSVNGFLNPTGKETALQFDLTADRLPLSAARPLLASVADQVEGTLGGYASLRGTTGRLRIDGRLGISQGLIKLQPTGVAYRINDSVRIDNNTLNLHNFILRDPENNTAYVNGTMTLIPHPTLAMRMHTDRIMVLNKAADGETFHGKLMASADADINGPADALQVAVQATALNGSDLYVPISNRKVVSENEYVVFISPAAPTRRQRTPIRPANTSRIDLQANVSVTPGVTVHLPMDFEQLTANVTAVGRGDIQVVLRNGKEPNILGDYEFTSGNFSISLLQLINKTFAIQDGSTLNFPGNINDARFNVNAVYSQRVNLATLMGSSTATSTSDSYVQVEDVITLSGTLQDPSIRFDIQLPNAEQSVHDQVFTYIDKNNERDMLNQSISLLLLGRFTPTGTAEGEANPFSDGSSLNLLTSSASSLVSSMVKVVDVNFKYQAGTTSGTGKFDVGISKQWNKFYFESTFGYGNTTNEIESTTPNVLVGDFEAGYRFNPYFNLYGFHRSNTSFYTRTEMPYKQGIGIKLTKDFDNIYDLFPWLRRRRVIY